MATHSSTLAWRIPWREEPGRLQSMGSSKESDTTEQVHFQFSPIPALISKEVCATEFHSGTL